MAAEPGAGGYGDLLDDDYDNDNVRTDINPEAFQYEAKLIPIPQSTKYQQAPDMPFKEVEYKFVLFPHNLNLEYTWILCVSSSTLLRHCESAVTNSEQRAPMQSCIHPKMLSATTV